MKSAIDHFNALPAGTFLIQRAHGGLWLIKCSRQWKEHWFHEDYVIRAHTGTVHHVNEFFTSDTPEEEFFATWEIKRPTLAT